MVVSVNQELKVDCLASAEPKPSMRWEKLDSSLALGQPGASAVGSSALSRQRKAGERNLLLAGKNQLAATSPSKC